MNGIGDFVNGGFPLPWIPVGMGEFVPGGFPLPQNPVGFFPSAAGSLPKAPDIMRSQIGNGGSTSCGMGCGCGMGALSPTDWGLVSGDTIIPQASLPVFLQGDTWVAGFPNLYLAGVALVVAVAVIGGSKARGRR